MNPDISNPSFELPAPSSQNGEGLPMVENAEPSKETKVAPMAPPSQASTVPVGTVPLQSTPIVSSGITKPASQSPLTADDNDLIEKEWVVKAKQIVAATKEDPHAQNKEISRFKADYLKKRYNKDIKVEES